MGYCTLGLSRRDCAEHIQPGIYFNFPTIAYWLLYAQGLEEKQRYSADIKIKDTENLPVSKKLKPPDYSIRFASTNPSAMCRELQQPTGCRIKALLTPFRPSCSIFIRMEDGAAQKTGSCMKYPSP